MKAPKPSLEVGCFGHEVTNSRRETPSFYPASTPRLSARVVVVAVRGDEHGDGRQAIESDFVVVLRSRRIEACDNQEIVSFASAFIPAIIPPTKT